MPFDTFMRNNLTVSVPLQVPVTGGYEVAATEKSHDLPAKTGFLYGKLSLDVGYDQKEGRFVGVMAKVDRKVWLVYVGLNLETTAVHQLGECHGAAFRASVNAVPVSPITQEPLK